MNRKFTFLATTFVLLAFLCIPLGMKADEAQYVFNTDAGIAALGITKPSAGTGTSLSTTSPYVVGQISMSVTHGSTDTRVWNSNGTLDLRIYKSGGTLTFAAADGYKITGISITGNTTGNFTVDPGTYTNGSWSNSTTGANSVTFTATNTGKINTITVTYEAVGGSTDPTITFSGQGANLGIKGVGELFTTTFTVSQEYLDDDITLELDGPGLLSTESIEQGADPTEVTWTYTPTSAGNINATITATSEGAQPVTFTITGEAKAYHNVIIASIANGTVTANPTQAYEGQYVTLTVTPAEGYELDELTVVDANNSPVTVNTNNVFQMPNSEVTVNATFVEVGPTTTDVLDLEFTGRPQSTTYGNWSGKKGASGAVYAGNSAGGNNSIQLRNSSNSGIITTTSGGKVKKVTVTWNSNTADDRTLDIYGKNTAYSGTSDLYNSTTQGTKLGSIVKGTSTVLTISGNYEYIGLRSNNGAMYLDEIDIDWETDGTPSISANDVEITYDATNGSIAYTVSNEPTPAGTMTASINDGATIIDLTIGTITGSPALFICAANTENTEHTATVTLTYTYGNNETVTKDVIITQAAAPVIYNSFADLLNNATTDATDVYINFDNWVITGANNSQHAFLSDGTNGCIIYGSDLGFTAGDVLSGTVQCKFQKYNGALELTQLTNSTTGLTVTPGGTIAVTDIAMADLQAINTGALVHYENLTCEARTEGSYTNYYLSDGTNEIQVYKTLLDNYASYLENTKVYNITGIFVQNNTTKRVNPRSADDVVEVVSSVPTITVTPTTLATFTYEEGNGPSAAQTITVSGTNLEDNITVALFDGNWSLFEISLTEDSGYGYSLTLPQSGGTVSETTVYVRMQADFDIGTGYAETINITSTSATPININLTGEVTAPTGPEVTWDLSTNSYASATTNLVTWSSNYVTMTNAKGTSTTNANNALGGNGYSHTRFYKNQVLTFTPVSGYEISSIEITAVSGKVAGFTGNDWTNATTETSGTLVTVIPTNGNSACSVVISESCYATSVTVSYAVSTLTPHNIAFDVDNGTVVATPASAVAGATVTLKIYPNAGYYLEDDAFIEVSYGSPSSTVSLTKVNDGTFTFEMPDADVTVYAIFSVYSGTYYTRVNSTADLIPGRHYIIANSKEAGDAYVMAAQGSGYREVAETTVVGNIIYQTTNAHEIVLSGDNTNFWTLYDDGYLYAGSSNKLNRRLDNSADNSGKWAVSINEEGAAVIVSQIEGLSVSNTIKFNGSNSPKRFTCYVPTSTMAPVYLYMKGGETDYEFYSNTTYNSLTIGELDIYTVHSPAVLNVTGTLTNEGDHENFIIEDGAQYYGNGVAATMQKVITGCTYSNENNAGYAMFASPMAIQPSNVANMLSNDYDLYAYDATQASSEWRNYKANNFSLALGQGYLYANGATTTLEFAGTVNSDFLGIDLNYAENDVLHSLNLVGNPCTMERDYDIINTDVPGFNYLKLNDTGDGFLSYATGTGNAVTLAPMEAIFVQAPAAGYRFVDAASHGAPGAGGGAPAPDPIIGMGMLNVSVNHNQGGVIDNAIVRFDNGSMLDKFRLSNNATELYVAQGGKDYSIVRAQNEGEMPVSFKASKNGTYTISVEPESVELAYLHLIDNMTGADIDLLVEPSYTFSAKTSDYASRFRLVFSANEGSNENGSETFAYYNGSEWVISNMGDATLQVVDVMGRVLSSETVSGNATLSTSNLSAGVYMMRLINGENVMTQKIVVR